ncbi:hypothetical protein JW960_03340 [candidate division KSB1 bacterium]|nr:hypothetical protein [candidate division KSB1 bacterium]
MNNYKDSFAFLLFLLFVPSVSTPSSAQSHYITQRFANSVAVEIRRPDLGGRSTGSARLSTTTLLVSGKLMLTDHLLSVVELPLSLWQLQSNYATESEYTFGNLYFGIELYSNHRSFCAELGFLYPSAPSENENNGRAASVGRVTNYIDHAEAWEPRRFPILAGVNYMLETSSSVIVRTDVGMALWMDRQHKDDVQSYIRYNSKLGYVMDALIFHLNFDGRYSLNDAIYYNEQLFQQFGLEMELEWNNIHPSFFFVKPLSDVFKDNLNSYLGVKIIAYLK